MLYCTVILYSKCCGLTGWDVAEWEYIEIPSNSDHYNNSYREVIWNLKIVSHHWLAFSSCQPWLSASFLPSFLFSSLHFLPAASCAELSIAWINQHRSTWIIMSYIIFHFTINICDLLQILLIGKTTKAETERWTEETVQYHFPTR